MSYDEILEYIATDLNVMFKIHRFMNKQSEIEKNVFFNILLILTDNLEKKICVYELFEYIYNAFQNRNESDEKLSFDDILFLLHVISRRDGVKMNDLIYLKNELITNRNSIYQYMISNDRKFKFNKKLNNI
jgi:hypothetical protein